MWAQRYTKNQRNIAVLAIDHQQFDMRAALGDSEKENYDYCEWLRDQMAYALGRLLARGK